MVPLPPGLWPGGLVSASVYVLLAIGMGITIRE